MDFGKKLKGGAIQDFDLKKVKVGGPRTLKKKKEKMKSESGATKFFLAKREACQTN